MRQSSSFHEVAIEGWAILLANINTHHRDAFWGVTRCLGFALVRDLQETLGMQSVYEFCFVLDPSSGKPFVLDDAAGHAKNAEDTESNICNAAIILPHFT